MKYGLKDSTIQKIRDVFVAFPELETAILYGSRAMGHYRNGSDIDLTLKGEKLTHNLANAISLRLDDLYLPYTFDLSVFHHIKNDELLNHIGRVGKTFYQRQEELSLR